MLKLAYSNLEFLNFPGRTPRIPLFKGKGGKGKGGREGKDREGRGWTGRDRGGKEGGMGGMGVVGGEGGALDMGSPPLETSSRSAPGRSRQTVENISRSSYCYHGYTWSSAVE